MTADARRKLRKGIDKLGILQPIVWNRRTGNIVGGHQRLDAMDHAAKSQDYMVTVAAVDLSEAQEKEANLLLNNASAQGDFDLEKLEVMIKGLDIEATGWDQSDVYRLFGDASPGIDPKTPEAKASVEKAIERIMELEKNTEEAKAAALTINREDFYMVVVFRTYEERKAFTDARGLEDNRYQSGESILAPVIREVATPTRVNHAGRKVQPSDRD